MPIERILGTDTRKAAFEKADRNFVAQEEDIVAHEVAIGNLTPHLTDLVTDADGAHGLKIEEGTFIPYYQDANSGVAGGYTVQTGTYYKIGKKVHIEVNLQISGVGTLGATTLYIKGLPFAPAANSLAKTVPYFKFLDIPTNCNQIIVNVIGGGVLRIDGIGDNVSNVSLLGSAILTSTVLVFTMEYITG